MHTIVTGGAGFIGSHVVELLLKFGHQITIFDDLSSGVRQNIPKHTGITFIEKNLLFLAPTEWPRNADAVIHLAAFPSVADSWIQLRRAHENNLSGTVHALEAARHNEIPRFIFASSAAVYGNAATTPLTEDAHTEPFSPYGLQKLAGEQYGRMIARECGITFIALRFFNAYGTRQLASSPYSGVISRFIQAMTSGKAITIRGDGSQTRDFVYVKDVAAAVAAAVHMPAPANNTLTCNIGSGTATTILDLARVLQRLKPHSRAPIQFVPLLPGEVLASRADIRKAADKLLFSPRWTLERGLADMLPHTD
jgi:Nucleoside-diphosphate-sugar epimerases